MQKRVKWIAGLSGLCCVVLSTGALSHAQAQNPCVNDAAKFCRDVQPGGGRVGRCLIEHITELSPECRLALSQQLTQGQAGADKASLASPGEFYKKLIRDSQ